MNQNTLFVNQLTQNTLFYSIYCDGQKIIRYALNPSFRWAFVNVSKQCLDNNAIWKCYWPDLVGLYSTLMESKLLLSPKIIGRVRIRGRLGHWLTVDMSIARGCPCEAMGPHVCLTKGSRLSSQCPTYPLIETELKVMGIWSSDSLHVVYFHENKMRKWNRKRG